MATNFPETGLDSLTNPTSTDTMSAVPHYAQHANANDAIKALEAKVGVDGSAVTTSHDYKLSNVTGSDKAASVTGTETLTNKTLEDGTALESSAAPTTDAQIANKKYVDDQVATANELSELTDVTITTPADNEVLQYNSGGANWENQTLAEAGIQGVLAEGAFVDGDKTKLDGIEALADVTDTANVTSAGALMDSEVTSLSGIKTLTVPDSTTISTFGATLVDDTDAATARTTLDVDQAGTDNSTNVTLAGTPDYITITGQEITRNQIDLTTDVTGVLPEANLPDASLTAQGVIEIATATEVDTGTDATRAISPDGFQDSKRNVRWLAFNLVEASTDVAVATNIAGDFVSPISGTILQSDTTPFYLYATNSTAGTTGNTVVDININGTSIMTTNKLSFDTTEKTTTTSATPPDLTTTTISVGDIITIDVDSLHTTAPKGLTVYIAIRED